MNTRAVFDGTLEEVADQVRAWRRKRSKGSRLPATLWKRAARLSLDHGASRVARVLMLDYYKLKDRTAKPPRTPAGSRHPEFVEVHAVQGAVGRGCRIELENGKGLKMSLELQASTPEEIATLARGLWGSR